MHDPLLTIGWDEDVATAFDALADPGDRVGRVAAVHRINCDVRTAAGTEVAAPSPRLAERPDGSTLPAVGDWVVLTDEEDTAEPAIVGILPRTTAIVRRDPADHTVEQVLATNVDQVWITHGMDHEPNLGRVERSLAVAWDSGAQPVVVTTKADLVDDPEGWAAPLDGVTPDVEVVVTSATHGLGIERLRRLTDGRLTIAVLGPSGAGKSSLVNALVGSEAMAVGAVREADAKGRHTTVTREMIELPGGGVILDTPGLRALGLWDAEVGVDLAFPDIVARAADCRFADCAHDREPGCAVKAAVDAGDLTPRRLESYRKLSAELVALTRQQEEQARQRPEDRPRRSRTGRRAGRRGRRR